jgi:vanillate O-demethylase monooxygenase subunit
MFVKNQWYVAADAAELKQELLGKWICGEPVAMYRTAAGAPVVLEDRCPHRRYALSKGKLVGDAVQCGYHGLEFDPSGACVKVPGQSSIPPRLRARAYPVAERHRWVWIWPGDPALADPAKIPDFHWNEEPGWRPVMGYIHIKANYQLLVDNLLDLTHETFVHAGTIGEAAVAATPAETKVEGRVVRVERVMPNCEAPPLFKKMYGFTGKIDRFQLIRYEPPSYIWIDARAYPEGTRDLGSAMRWWVMNALTPESDGSTHYYWSVSRAFALDSDEASSALRAGIVRTFQEDLAILELQQRYIETDDPRRPLMSVNCDAGNVASRRIVAELVAAERAKAAE